ncbi:hypothetical protein Tco_0951980 [Tanacetum coccineum]|uniref:Uncharacterized protein n=1 Tax=Tanacetum coccineum TaxID=301880 RepID=A0ABQ5DVR0_9ASTR
MITVTLRCYTIAEKYIALLHTLQQKLHVDLLSPSFCGCDDIVVIIVVGSEILDKLFKNNLFYSLFDLNMSAYVALGVWRMVTVMAVNDRPIHTNTTGCGGCLGNRVECAHGCASILRGVPSLDPYFFLDTYCYDVFLNPEDKAYMYGGSEDNEQGDDEDDSEDGEDENDRTDIQKESQKRPNQARDGKDKVKSKPKSVKVRKSTQTKSKVNQVKKIQLEGLKLPNLKLYYKNNKTRAEIKNWGKYNLRDRSCQPTQNPSFPPNKTQEQLTGPLHPLLPCNLYNPMDKTHPPPPLSPPSYTPFPSDFDGLDDSKRSTRRLNGCDYLYQVPHTTKTPSEALTKEAQERSPRREDLCYKWSLL